MKLLLVTLLMAVANTVTAGPADPISVKQSSLTMAP
jgi:hypothetical protein